MGSLNITSEFWADVLKAWCRLNYKSLDSPEGQMIWCNSKVKIGGSVINWSKCYAKGLKWVSQLYQGGSVISFISASTMYELTLIEFHGLISAIPTRWRKLLRQNSELENNTLYDKLLLHPHLTRHAYAQLLPKCDLSVITAKWNKVIGRQCFSSVDAVVSNFKRLYALTNIPKLRSFQFRTLHNALVLNTHLFRWKIKTSICVLSVMQKKRLWSICSTNAILPNNCG